MGKLIAAMGALIAAACASPLHAEEMPWCVELDVFTKNCAYARYDECMAVAKDALSTATATARCIRNPKYEPPPAEAAKARPAQAAKKQR